MPIAQFNPDVPSTTQTPNTYLFISTAPTTTATSQPKDLFLVATGLLAGSQMTNSPYSLTAGTAIPNEIKQYSSVKTCNQRFNRHSPIANRFRSAIQEVPIGINIYLASLAEPSNTGFAGIATKLFTFAGTASGSGEIKVRIAGHLYAIPVADGDTAATIAASGKTAADARLLDCPMVTAALISSTTLPFTYVVRGADGNDSAVMVDIPPEITGITISPGTITITTNAAGHSAGPSIFTLQDDSTVYAVSIPVSTTPTQAAALIAAEINATTGPLSATSALGVVTLFYNSGWYTKKLQMSSTEDLGGQVYTLADRHNSAGTITTVATVPGTPTLTGLQGSGAPSLTSLLDNRAKFDAFQEWAIDYLDATSTSAIYAHMELYGNGYYNQGQRATYVSTDPLETAAAVATAASPQLGNSWRPSVGVYQGAPCQGGAYATQTAARLVATDLPFNMSGQILVSGNIEPMLPGRAETDLDPVSVDVALGSYHLFVFKGNKGQVQIVRGKTCWTASNTEWGDWSFGRIFDSVRFGMRAFLNNRFQGRVLFVGGGTVRVPNGFTPQDMKDAIGEYLDSIDGILVDGAARLKQYIEVEPVPTDPGFLRIYFRIAPPRELQIISGVIASAPEALAA